MRCNLGSAWSWPRTWCDDEREELRNLVADRIGVTKRALDRKLKAALVDA